MIKRNQWWAFLIGLFISSGIYAQDTTKSITLSDAIELGVRNSKSLKGSQARIEEATARLKQAVNNQLPDVKVTGSYLRLNSANVDLKTKNTSGGNNAPPKISQAMYGILNGSLPLYAGGRIRYGIEAAKYLEEAAKLDADNDREDVIQNTVEAYVNLYKSKASVDLVKESLTSANQRVKDFSNLEQNGLLARNDLL
ncbi:MAG TPA: TolC family protein, partial [Chitinophagaceae bacterium]